MAEATAHADVLNETAQGQIRSIIDRVNRLEIEKEEIAAQIAEVYAESKSNGFDVKILKKVVRILKQDRAKRQEEEAILDLYLSAAGDGPAFEPAQRADTSLGVASVTVTAGDGGTQVVTPDSLAVSERIKHGADVIEALYAQAVTIVRREHKASANLLHRCLGVGYERADQLLDRMEAQGVVTWPNSSGVRAVVQSEAA